MSAHVGNDKIRGIYAKPLFLEEFLDTYPDFAGAYPYQLASFTQAEQQI